MRASNEAIAHAVLNFSRLYYPEERLAMVETTYTEFIVSTVELLVHSLAVTPAAYPNPHQGRGAEAPLQYS